MLTTIAVLAIVCAHSLLYILVIPPLAPVKAFMHFMPRDIREAAKGHPDPTIDRRIIGYLLTAVVSTAYLGALFLLGADGLQRGYGFWRLFGRFMLFMYGYKLFDILVQDQYIVITKKYFVRFFPETEGCRSWHDRNFNTGNQLIRLAVFPFACAALAWLALRIWA